MRITTWISTAWLSSAMTLSILLGQAGEEIREEKHDQQQR